MQTIIKARGRKPSKYFCPICEKTIAKSALMKHYISPSHVQNQKIDTFYKKTLMMTK